MYKLKVDDGKIGGYTGIEFAADGTTNDDLKNAITTHLPSKPDSDNPSATFGGRRRKRRTKVKSKKRAHRRKRTRHQH